jgi:hypothetical protein
MLRSSLNRRSSRKYGQKVSKNATTGGITSGNMRKLMSAGHLGPISPP